MCARKKGQVNRKKKYFKDLLKLFSSKTKQPSKKCSEINSITSIELNNFNSKD